MFHINKFKFMIMIKKYIPFYRVKLNYKKNNKHSFKNFKEWKCLSNINIIIPNRIFQKNYKINLFFYMIKSNFSKKLNFSDL